MIRVEIFQGKRKIYCYYFGRVTCFVWYCYNLECKKISEKQFGVIEKLEGS